MVFAKITKPIRRWLITIDGKNAGVLREEDGIFFYKFRKVEKDFESYTEAITWLNKQTTEEPKEEKGKQKANG